MGKGDVEAVAGVVSVRLNGLFQRWPLWGHTLMYVANTMANTKGYFNRSRKGSTKLEDSMTVRIQMTFRFDPWFCGFALSRSTPCMLQMLGVRTSQSYSWK